MKSKKQHDIQELLIRFLENDLDDAQQQQLLEWSRSDPKAVRQYCEFITDYAIVDTIISAQIEPEYGNSDDSAFDHALWSALLDDQKTSPEIAIPKEEPKRELIQKVIYPPREKRRISKFNLTFLITNIAAVLCLIVILKFAPSKGVEVATLSDSINITWAGPHSSIQNNTRLVSGEDKYTLKEGIAELAFDNHTKAVIEAPAKYQILANDRIFLHSGKVYVTVPKEAIGFSVYTPTAKVIDLGTEFAVEVDDQGETKLYVYKGKTSLVAGEDSNRISMEVTQNNAKRISSTTGTVTDISLPYQSFVRDINSQTNTIWHGENVNLTSIIAGFEGFRQISSLIGLDPVKGTYVASSSQAFRVSNNIYNLVANSKFIDGVFVPDGRRGPTQITSMGHTFNCPDASGVFTHEIAVYKGTLENQQTTIPPLTINGQKIVNDPVLMIHSNTGITFDLQAVRESLPQGDLKAFKAMGMLLEQERADLEFRVLIDGEMKYERKIERIDSNRTAIPFSIDIDSKDRFLTLIVTDGPSDSFANDFFYLINPELVFQ